ncbi:DUF2512 family protein [Lederbergia citri]|uniref:DUF2512 family protein n=1 Tax=Lederbergia citri TaxID=2833580 RepID=A0A942TGI8_9BACI|nr:DUF2512 family protein [Lederbergia citri]MBS4197228.1 DUF2512 family protein [Lederbergia citri]
MLNLIMKLIVCPIVVIIAANFLTNVHFERVYQPIILGFTLAVVGHLMELAILNKGTFWISNTVDFIVSAAAIYFISYFFVGAYVTFGGALITAALLTVVEFFVHLWLIRSGRARKEPSL